MKKLILFSFIFILTFSTFSQEKKGQIGFFVGPSVKYTKIKTYERSSYGIKANDNAVLPGLEGGVILKNEKYDLALGLFYNLPSSSKYLCIECGITYKFQFMGAFLEFILEPEKTMNFSFAFMAGPGRMVFDIPARASSSHGLEEKDKFSCFFLEPNIRIWKNIGKSLKAGAGFGFRIISGLDIPNKSSESEDFGGFSIGIILRYISFKR